MSIPTAHNGVFYSDFMARLATLRDASTYLEIGVQSGLNLAKIPVANCFAVDPNFRISVDVTDKKQKLSLFRMTSDSFFRKEASDCFANEPFDLCFLDGMHLFEYLLRDFYNAERFASKNSIIMLHDCMPFDGEMIERVLRPEGRTPGPNEGAWTGDVWKIVPILKKYRPEVQVTLVDCAPTGLVCVSNLDPKSETLKENYHPIITEFSSFGNTLVELQEFYSTSVITCADDILEHFNHSRYFQC